MVVGKRQIVLLLVACLFASVGGARVALGQSEEEAPGDLPLGTESSGPLPSSLQAVAAQLPDAQPEDSADQQSSDPLSSDPLSSDSSQDLPNHAEVAPRTFYLRDAEGNLVPVLLDMSYEEFERLYRLQHGLERPDTPPRFTLTQLALTGQTSEGRVELDATVTFRVHADDWVRIPLGMSRGLLREEPIFQMPVDGFLTFDPEQGYVAWVQSAAEEELSITLPMIVPIQQAGREQSLQIDLPLATTSQLDLNTAGPELTARVSPGATLQSVSPADDQRALISVLGPAGDFELAWQRRDRAQPSESVSLEAVEQTLVWVRGQEQVTLQTDLTIRSYRGMLQEFIVRLPPGGRLVPGDTEGHAFSPVEQRPGASEEHSEGPRLRVTLNEPSADPVRIRLTVELPGIAMTGTSQVEVEGIVVEGAVSQSGQMALAVDSDWQVQWELGEGTRRVDSLPDSLHREEVVAGFEHYRAPFSLRLNVDPKRVRIGVAPVYVMQVDADRVALTAYLRYEIYGARASFLDLAMPGWTVNAVGPPTLVKQNTLMLDQVDPMVIGLVQPMSGSLEMVVRAQYPVDLESGELLLPLPHPAANVTEGALLVIDVADDVEFTLTNPESLGLTPARLPEDLSLNEESAEPLVYRVRREATTGALEAQVARQSQTITTISSAKITLNSQQLLIEQEMNCLVRYEPLEELVLEVPEEAVHMEGLLIEVDGQPYETTLVESGNREDGSPALVALLLEPPVTDTMTIRVNYELPISTAEASQLLTIGLAIVQDATLTKSTIRFRHPEDVTIEVADPHWSTSGIGTSQLIATSTSAHSIRIQRNRQLQPMQAPLAVHRVWIQTWLTARHRRDRAVFQCSGTNSAVTIGLPEGVSANSLMVLVDRLPVPTPLILGEQIHIPLPRQTTPSTRHVEVVYQVPRDSQQKQQAISLPRVVDAEYVERTYWQLITSRGDIVLLNSKPWAPEQVWSWNQWRFDAWPTLSQEDLEDWSGGTSQAAPPAQSRQLVYSHLGAAEEVRLTVVPRSWFFLSVAGGVLLIGMLVVYLPFLRRPELLIATTACLLISGLAFPEPALMLAQWTAWGAVFLLLAVSLHWVLVQRRQGRGVIRGTSHSIADTHHSDLSRRAAEENSQASTRAAPSLLSTGDWEGKS